MVEGGRDGFSCMILRAFTEQLEMCAGASKLLTMLLRVRGLQCVLELVDARNFKEKNEV